MVRVASLFSQLLSLFPRLEFERLVHKHQAQKGAKGFDCWTQFVSMLFCQLAQAKSLREISGGLQCCLGKLTHLGVKAAPKRSTLSYANAHRPWEMYRDLFYKMADRCRAHAPRKRFRFKNRLLSLDSTLIKLCLSLFPWATYRQTKGAVKLHLLLDHDGYFPIFAVVTSARTHDVKIAQTMRFPKGSILAMDRGYVDYALFRRLTDEGVFFVTRQKGNAVYDVVETRRPPKNTNVLKDQTIRLVGAVAKKKRPPILRRIVVWDDVNEREITLVTNHLDFGASTISAIYKDRWQIELFFKAIKQNLKIKTFVGTSENALLIQIWTALIAMLLIKYLQFRSSFGWSLSNLVALLRWNLFTYRDLYEWIEHPFDTPPRPPGEQQLTLPLPFLGQHQPMKRET